MRALTALTIALALACASGQTVDPTVDPADIAGSWTAGGYGTWDMHIPNDTSPDAVAIVRGIPYRGVMYELMHSGTWYTRPARALRGSIGIELRIVSGRLVGTAFTGCPVGNPGDRAWSWNDCTRRHPPQAHENRPTVAPHGCVLLTLDLPEVLLPITFPLGEP